MAAGLLIAILVVALATLLLAAIVWFGARAQSSGAAAQTDALLARLQDLERALASGIGKSSTDLTGRIEQSSADVREKMTERLASNFAEVRTTIEKQLGEGRDEQSRRLNDVITRVDANLEKIRAEVDRKLGAIGEQVSKRLDENLREGFQQFEKVQLHLQKAEEQLRNVGVLGNSVNDLNNLLKLPHLRGRFGEQSLERLLADFLPATMYELQASPTGSDARRADAVIKFPEARLPIDAKFPREQVAAVFENSSDPAGLAEARKDFARVIKEQARRIAEYIEPENGTTEMALMYLPSETLYFETILNSEVGERLNQLHVFPVSPNTLIVTLQAIAMVHGWYRMAEGFRQTREELRKAQKSFEYFDKNFRALGDSLERAREAYGTAGTHLDRYRIRVTGLTGAETPALDLADEPERPLVVAGGKG